MILGIGKLCTVCTPKEGSEARYPYWEHHRRFSLCGWWGNFGISANQLTISFATPPTVLAKGSNISPETDLDQFYPGFAQHRMQHWDSQESISSSTATGTPSNTRYFHSEYTSKVQTIKLQNKPTWVQTHEKRTKVFQDWLETELLKKSENHLF